MLRKVCSQCLLYSIESIVGVWDHGKDVSVPKNWIIVFQMSNSVIVQVNRILGLIIYAHKQCSLNTSDRDHEQKVRKLWSTLKMLTQYRSSIKLYDEFQPNELTQMTISNDLTKPSSDCDA